MMIYQVEAHAPFASKEGINHELGVADEVLAIVGGVLFCAQRVAFSKWIKILLCAIDEQTLSDVLDATDFNVKRIKPLGTPHETYVELEGWHTPQAWARRKEKKYLLDSSPRRPASRRHAAQARQAGHHAAIAKFFVPPTSAKLGNRQSAHWWII